MSKLIAIDGVDASGKQTHTELLAKYLKSLGKKVLRLSFPMYNSESSSLVKLYLNGSLGKNAEDVDAYAASTFFAADRFATYRMDWGKAYEDDEMVIIADRYVSSNMIHQASKIENISEKDKFLDWLYDFEFNLYKIPKPDMTIFLDMPPKYGRMLIEGRNNKFSGNEKLDIHESDFSYLEKSYENAKYVSEKFGWQTICCVENEKIRPIDEIQEDIRKIAEKVINA
ncbi:MAG: deoxynucleoside kinase [Clostridia bacterium]|nr:deoxynucleoside kinase [Clostridia bacterium]